MPVPDDAPAPNTNPPDPDGTYDRDSGFGQRLQDLARTVPPSASPPPAAAPDQLIAGRYKLLRQIGEGGMGSVWLAEQREPVKRAVAVKLIKAGIDSRAVLARFDAERQALAVMDHPNIARVYDGGVTDGHPYFVMELVNGTPITAYCDAKRLTPRQRLELFVPVCQAIQHAHMKGVIHRDIKPSNVLVAEYDGRPTPKVIDFGVAKATGGALTELTLDTGFGNLVGTPEYMSPEQADPTTADIDTRSDVYSLGVLLYELLVGTTPVDRKSLGKAAILEVLRIVREVDAPRPSAKLSTLDALPSVAANRGTEPKALSGLLRSELDWLVLKALEKDRNRRYDSANGFAADVQRYLAGEAVTAVPPSTAYRVRKWVRKNKGLVTASGLVAASLLAGTGLALWQADRAEREAGRARGEEAKAQTARDAAELALVRSYLRPIGFNTGEFDRDELIALDELTGQDDRVKLLFLREALSDGERALRIARRAERVVQAAVGLSLNRRAAALELTGAKQRDPAADPRVRLCACWLAVELGGDDLPALREGFETLVAEKVTDWDNFVNTLPAHTRPTTAVALARVLATLIGETEAPAALEGAALGLAALIPRLAPADLVRTADALATLIGKAGNPTALRRAADGLDALADRIPPVAAGKTFDALVGVMLRTTDTTTLLAATRGLAALAPRLDPAATRSRLGRAAHALANALGNASGSDVRNTTVGLADLIPHIDPADARASLGRATGPLLAVIRTTAKYVDLAEAANGLSYLAAHLDPAALGEVVDALGKVTQKNSNGDMLQAAAAGLAAIAPHLDPAAAGMAFDALAALPSKTRHEGVLREIGEGLAALAPRLDPTSVPAAADALAEIIRTSADVGVVGEAACGLAALAPRLDPAAIRPRLTQAADALVGVLGKNEASGYAFHAAGRGLAALAPLLDPAATRPRLTQAADALVGVIERATRPNPLYFATSGLTHLAPHLDPAAAGRSFDALAGALGKDIKADADQLGEIANGLATLATRLDVERRSARCVNALGRIATVMRTGAHGGFEEKSLAGLLVHLDTLPPLLDLLRDPGCVGELQTAVLARLEELAYPEPGRAAVFAGLAADPHTAVMLPALKLADDEYRQGNRRFRTVSDAARWLADRHPEIDLDAPYHNAPPGK